MGLRVRGIWPLRRDQPTERRDATHIPQIEYRIPAEISPVEQSLAIDGERDAEEGEGLGLEVREGGAENFHLICFLREVRGQPRGGGKLGSWGQERGSPGRLGSRSRRDGKSRMPHSGWHPTRAAKDQRPWPWSDPIHNMGKRPRMAPSARPPLRGFSDRPATHGDPGPVDVKRLLFDLLGDLPRRQAPSIALGSGGLPLLAPGGMCVSTVSGRR